MPVVMTYYIAMRCPALLPASRSASVELPRQAGRGAPAILVQPFRFLVFDFGFIDFPLGSAQRAAGHLFDRTCARKTAG